MSITLKDGREVELNDENVSKVVDLLSPAIAYSLPASVADNPERMARIEGHIAGATKAAGWVKPFSYARMAWNLFAMYRELTPEEREEWHIKQRANDRPITQEDIDGMQQIYVDKMKNMEKLTDEDLKSWNFLCDFELQSEDTSSSSEE